LLKVLLKKIPILNVIYELCGENLVIFGPVVALLGAMYLALDQSQVLKALSLVMGGLVITLIGINKQLNKRGRGMTLFSNDEPKTPFEELKDVIVMLGKAIALRNALRDGVGIDDIDEAFAFVKSVPEAITGAREIDFETLTDEQHLELRELVVELWDIPDNEKLDEALPYLVNGLTYLGKGISVLV